MGPSRTTVAVASLVLAVALLIAVQPGALAQPSPPSTWYRPPVAGPVVDHFRPPASAFGPGNRGIDFATAPGSDVVASAAGDVVFAGAVGGARHVVVLHPDGLRTSYSFLESVAVSRGDRVRAGDVVGRSGDTLHFGVRAGDTYLDPAALLAGEPPAVHLVPEDAAAPASEAEERRGVLRGLLRGAVAATVDTVRWVAGNVADATGAVVDDGVQHLRGYRQIGRAILHYIGVTEPVEMWVELDRSYDALRDGQDACTDPAVAAPRLAERRIAVLIGGFGSAGGDAAVLDVDTDALGYRSNDVMQFSYNGGRVPGIGALPGVAESRYDGADAQGDLEVAARRLRAVLGAIRINHPGTPVDLIAHSQGGVVARLALRSDTHTDPLVPEIRSLVTLGTPHAGSDWATAAHTLAATGAGDVLTAAGWRVGLDPRAPAVAQLDETSALMARLADRPLPGGVDVTSIVAAGDVVVALPRSVLPGATHAVVPLSGPLAHHLLPGADETQREIALAITGRAPTCRPDRYLAGVAVAGVGIAHLQDGVGAIALYAALRHGGMLPDVPVPTTPGPVALPRRGGRR